MIGPALGIELLMSAYRTRHLKAGAPRPEIVHSDLKPLLFIDINHACHVAGVGQLVFFGYFKAEGILGNPVFFQNFKGASGLVTPGIDDSVVEVEEEPGKSVPRNGCEFFHRLLPKPDVHAVEEAASMA